MMHFPDDHHAARVMFCCNEAVGLGHMRRTLALAGYLRAHTSLKSQLIITGSPVAQNFPLPLGADYIKLPALTKVGVGQYASGSIPIPFRQVGDMRRRALRPPSAAVTVRYRRRVRTLTRRQRAREGEIASLAAEALAGMRVIKGFGSEDFEHDRVTCQSAERRQAGIEASRVKARFSSTIDILGACETVLVLVVDVLRVAAGALTPGDLVVIFSRDHALAGAGLHHRPGGRATRGLHRAGRAAGCAAGRIGAVPPPRDRAGARENREPRIENRRPASDDRRPATGNRRPATGICGDIQQYSTQFDVISTLSSMCRGNPLRLPALLHDECSTK